MDILDTHRKVTVMDFFSKMSGFGSKHVKGMLDYKQIVAAAHMLMVSTLDSESSDPSSNLGRTSNVSSWKRHYSNVAFTSLVHMQIT